MKQAIILLLAALHCLPQSHAQAPTVGKISGSVLDKQNQQPIEFATISIFSLRDSSLVSGGVTDEKGQFTIDKLNYGGYLDQVEVTADKSTLQLGVDRKIFNVDKTAVAKGGTATDVLRATPTLNVDMNGNVSLRGSQGVTILINGRPSALTGGNRKALLDQIPASMVERIEIITNPSAKYDPDGLSGIINIVLKKNKLEGFSGNVSAGIGSPFNKYDFQAGLNYQNSKINAYANYSYNYSSRFSNFNSLRTTLRQDTSFSLQTAGGSRNRNQTHFAKAGIDFMPTEQTTLSASASINPFNHNSLDTNNYHNINNDWQYSGGSQRLGEEAENGLGFDANLNWNQKFKKYPKRELVFDANYSQNLRPELNNYTQNYFGSNPNPTWLQRTQPNNDNRTLTLQLDYTQPSKDQARKWEIGAKSIVRSIDNALLAENYDYDQQTYAKDPSLSNTFQYREQVHALYSTFGGKYKKFNYQAGLRLEQALTQSSLIELDTTFTNNYFSFFPSAHLGYEIKTGHNVQLSYSRRITRPSIWTLNPFPNYSDPLNLRRGNPFLLPEYINSFDLTYVAYIGGLSLSNSLYYRHSTDVMRRLVAVDTTSGVSTVSYFNFDNTQQYGLEVVLGGMVAKICRFNLSANVYKMVEDGSNLDSDYTNNSLWANFSLYTNVTVPKGALKGLQAEIVCSYTPPMRLVLGKIRMGAWSSVAISKSFLKNKLTVSLRVEDPFNLQHFSFDLSDTNFDNHGTYKWESRIAWLNLNYTFGKMTNSQRKQRRPSNGGNQGGGMGL